jgi:hypothetical protein
VATRAQRDAVTNMINNALAVNAMDKLRYAQDVALRLQEYLQAQPILGLLANQRFLSI